MSVCVSVCVCACVSICFLVCESVYLCVWRVCKSVCLSVCHECACVCMCVCVATCIQRCVCYASVQCMCTFRGSDGNAMYVHVQRGDTIKVYRTLGTQIEIESVKLNRMHVHV